MGKAVNQTELAEILGVSDVTLWEWQKNGLPIEQIGERGTANRYDTAKVIAWRVQQELQRAGKAESQRDREARLRGDILELELGKERGLLVSVNEIKPTWEARVLVAAAFQMSRASRLSAILEASPGIEAKREVLKKEDAEFLTRLGVDGERMQQELEALLMKVSESEAQDFLKRIAGYDDKQSPDQPAQGGVEGADPPEKNPPL